MIAFLTKLVPAVGILSNPTFELDLRVILSAVTLTIRSRRILELKPEWSGAELVFLKRDLYNRFS